MLINNNLLAHHHHCGDGEVESRALFTLVCFFNSNPQKFRVESFNGVLLLLLFVLLLYYYTLTVYADMCKRVFVFY